MSKDAQNQTLNPKQIKGPKQVRGSASNLQLVGPTVDEITVEHIAAADESQKGRESHVVLVGGQPGRVAVKTHSCA